MRRRGLLIQLAVVALLLVTSPNAAGQDPPLTITEPPTIAGLARVGETLMTVDGGEWSPEDGVTASYRWRRCDATGMCADIGGETNPVAYKITDLDGGHTLRMQLTVTKGGEFDVDESASTVVVPPTPPSNAALPGITGVAREGHVLTALGGDWRGTPPFSYSYAWQRCDAGGQGCDAPHAAGSTYTLSAADVGTTVRVVETAKNAADTVSISSQPTNRVARAPLVNAGPPTIVGVAEFERSLTATPGQWVTSAPIDFVYRWLRCNADDSGCDQIPGANSAAYQVRLLDVGFRLRVRVTAISDGGFLTRDSAPTVLVPAPAGVLPFTQSGTSAPTPIAALMRPFPRVRIKGYYTPSGAVLQLVTIKGAAGARIALACRGSDDCAFRHRARRGRQRVRVRSLERSYRAGAKLTIRVTKPALIGKYTRIVIRANRAPRRRDRCLMPAGTQPVQCPSVG